MPSFSSVRLTGRWDCSTNLMISSFSEAGYLIRRLPIRDRAFFEQPQFEGLLGNHLLQFLRLTPKLSNLIRRGGSGGIPSKPPLAGLEEFLRPAVIEAFGDPLGE